MSETHERLEQIQETLDAAYQPESTRETLATAIGEALDAIEDELQETGEEAEDEALGEEDAGEGDED